MFSLPSAYLCWDNLQQDPARLLRYKLDGTISRWIHLRALSASGEVFPLQEVETCEAMRPPPHGTMVGNRKRETQEPLQGKREERRGAGAANRFKVNA